MRILEILLVPALCIASSCVAQGAHANNDLSTCGFGEEESLESSLLDTLEKFSGEVNVEEIIKNVLTAEGSSVQMELCKDIATGEVADALSCIAKDTGKTVGIEIGGETAHFGAKAEANLSFLWGEKGQFACAQSKGRGVANELLAATASAGVIVRSGGWQTVAPLAAPKRLCFSVGWNTLVGFAANIMVDPELLDLVNAIEKIQAAGSDMDLADPLEKVLKLLVAINDIEGVISVGVDWTAGLEFSFPFLGLDVIMPEVSVTQCIEELLYCDGEGCDSKDMVE